MTNETNLSLYDAWVIADKAWMSALRQAFPHKKTIGDLRYLSEGKGEPGSELRIAYDAFISAGNAWRHHTVESGI